MCKKLSVKVILFLCLSVFGFSSYNAQAEYKEINVTNGGTIEGTVKWSGATPEIQQFAVTKDKDHCAAETKPSPRLIISPSNNGVKDAVVYLVDIKEGKKIAGLSKPVMDQIQCVYQPRMFVVPAGTEFEMTTSDDILHNIHMYGAATYNLAFPIKGQKITKKLRKPGVVELICDAGHYWMSAYVHVVEHPYYAITDENGKFGIDNVPPGTYKLQAWHEGWVIKEKQEKEGKPSKLIFTEPIVIEKEVKVDGNATVTVDFELSGK